MPVIQAKSEKCSQKPKSSKITGYLISCRNWLCFFHFYRISSRHRLRFTFHVTGFNLLKQLLYPLLIFKLSRVHFSEIDSFFGIDFSLITKVFYAYCEKEKYWKLWRKNYNVPSSKRLLMLLGVPSREENKGVIYFCTHLKYNLKFYCSH